MKVDVKNALARRLETVRDEPEAVRVKPSLLGDFGCQKRQPSHQRAIFFGEIVERRNVLFGDDENVGGRLRVQVLEGVKLSVLVDLLARNSATGYLAEDAFWHRNLLQR